MVVYTKKVKVCFLIWIVSRFDRTIKSLKNREKLSIWLYNSRKLKETKGIIPKKSTVLETISVCVKNVFHFFTTEWNPILFEQIEDSESCPNYKKIECRVQIALNKPFISE